MRLTRFFLYLGLVAVLALAACSQKQSKALGGKFGAEKPDCTVKTCLVKFNYLAANAMANVLDGELEEGDGIIVTDFIYLGDPGLQSTLGKLIPEQISSRLAQQGFRPISRSQGLPEAKPDAPEPVAMLVGSYTTAYNVLYVNARVVLLRNSATIAGYDYELPASSNLRTLVPGTWGQAGIEPTVRTSFTTAARQ